MITQEQLRKDLIAMQIRPTDTLLIHSSMKRIGPVEGGAEAVLDMLTDYFKDGGLLVFPTLTYVILKQEHPRFDVRTTPSVVGILSELFRKRPGVIRSLHPTHSVAAWGRDAAEFTAGHENANTPMPKGSPWWKLLERRGKILFIGTGISCNTFLHGVDEWIGLPDMRSQTPRAMEIVDHDGRILKMDLYHHALGRNAYYGCCEEAFEAAGALIRGKFGNADCHLLDCRRAAKVFGLVLPDRDTGSFA